MTKSGHSLWNENFEITLNQLIKTSELKKMTVQRNWLSERKDHTTFMIQQSINLEETSSYLHCSSSERHWITFFFNSEQPLPFPTQSALSRWQTFFHINQISLNFLVFQNFEFRGKNNVRCRSLHFWISFKNVTSFHQTKAGFIGILSRGHWEACKDH